MAEKDFREAIKETYGKYYGQLVGKTVKRVATSTREHEVFFGLVFDDETTVWISRDEEGNGPGFLDIQPR